jgi:hypothetical protein
LTTILQRPLLLDGMTTDRTFSLARLLFGLVGVSIVCATILLLPKPWTPYPTWWIWPYIYELILPIVGFAFVFYWSRIFAKLDVLQRVVIAGLLGFFLALGFTIAFIDCLVPILGTMFYKSPFAETHFQSGTLPLQDVRYGYHGDQLLFVIFQTSVNGQSHTEFKIAPISDSMKAGTIVSHYDHWIELPDGTRKDLPISRAMFEYDLGGTFSSRPVDVTLDEFRQWTASRPEIYSIEKLEQFVAQQRKHI